MDQKRVYEIIERVLADIAENVKNEKKRETFRFPDEDWSDENFELLVETVKSYVKTQGFYKTYTFRTNGSCMHQENHIQMFRKGEPKTGWNWASEDWTFE
jgi:hypothetical protein